ncbi:hypothetical protein B0J11DRAFT_61795 [Dendryphion nanum]|uniref:Uncharacterized protein n=1 Tax=Dendryphion nanum TaxID=256645 RepID=A0A9P9IHX7_9PLEO|nr:hypothetical protein B0J11DRAFT_61795 [Dendryphion nanum]
MYEKKRLGMLNWVTMDEGEPSEPWKNCVRKLTPQGWSCHISFSNCTRGRCQPQPFPNHPNSNLRKAPPPKPSPGHHGDYLPSETRRGLLFSLRLCPFRWRPCGARHCQCCGAACFVGCICLYMVILYIVQYDDELEGQPKPIQQQTWRDDCICSTSDRGQGDGQGPCRRCSRPSACFCSLGGAGHGHCASRYAASSHTAPGRIAGYDTMDLMDSMVL